jgi:hypothetical protein
MIWLSIAVLSMGIGQLALIHWVWRLSAEIRELRRKFIECKDDSIHLERQIRSIEPNCWVDGRRPTPIRPVPSQERHIP